MRTIDVEALPAELRALVGAVRAGETVRVVERGEVVAELVRPPVEPGAVPATEPASVVGPASETAPRADRAARLQALADAGHVRLPTNPDRQWRGFSAGAGLDPEVVQNLLDGLRADRF